MKNKIKKFLVKGNLSNQDNRKNAGITLVALVITIIILLILAGITISQLSNNGLFDKSKQAKEQYQNAQEDENDKIAKYSNEIDSYVNGNRDTVTIPQAEYQRLLKSSNSNNYSVQEQVIGTWIDGKPLYQKTIVKTTPSTKNTWHKSWISLGNTYNLLNVFGYVNSTDSEHVQINIFDGCNGITCALHQEGIVGNVGILMTHDSYLNREAIITIQYTKTTD